MSTATASADNAATADADAQPVVEFIDVQKTYDGRTMVISDLHLEVGDGEFLTMLGPSGSGKTTCLMMLAGFEPTSGGDIRLKGRSVTRVPPYKRNIGMVFQNYALFPHMTVGENVAYPLKVRGVPQSKREELVQEMLEIVRLQGFASRRPNQLSGGQQQRVALARALVFEPTLVLMDEPLGALDRQLREHMQLELKALQQRLGVTVVYVTHDQGEALTMSDRIAIFNEGDIQQCASPEDVYNRPDNAFVAQFIGESNTLSGRVREMTQNGMCTVDIDDTGQVVATPIQVDSPGQETLLSLRPEHVVLNPTDESLENIFEARVESIVFMGEHIRAELSLGDHPNFIVKVPNSWSSSPPTKGDLIRIGWRAQDCRALDFPANDH